MNLLWLNPQAFAKREAGPTLRTLGRIKTPKKSSMGSISFPAEGKLRRRDMSILGQREPKVTSLSFSGGEGRGEETLSRPDLYVIYYNRGEF